MKKTCKTVASLLLVLMLCLSLAAPALADEPSTITFDGTNFIFGPGSEYTNTDLFDGFKGVMPGDVLTESITFKNEAQDYDYVRLYLKRTCQTGQGSGRHKAKGSAGAAIGYVKHILHQACTCKILLPITYHTI